MNPEELANLFADRLWKSQARGARSEMTNWGDHLDWILDISANPYSSSVLGHGSKGFSDNFKGFSRLLHGLGDPNRILHSVAFSGNASAASGFGASRPYMGDQGPVGFIFEPPSKSNPDAGQKAIAVWVDPRLGPAAMKQIRDYIPAEIPVVSADKISEFIKTHGPAIKAGSYKGKKIDLFARTRKSPIAKLPKTR
jgi:hypothetical protein